RVDSMRVALGVSSLGYSASKLIAVAILGSVNGTVLVMWLFENLVICHVPVHVNQLQESAIFVVSDIRSPEHSVVS
ncbi:MAG: hypothetical protein VX024_12450, partial [SAR324 cluster bacterium]|nr:hypothetical protein [SAR324 cluster bacterium]